MPFHYTRIEDLAPHYDQIYLSPHLDDAALSCAGSIANFVALGHSVLVVTICAGSPAPNSAFSAFAQQQHRQWRLPPEQAVQQRIQEDIAALETLGADCLLLDLLDAIYRVPAAYHDEASLFGLTAAGDPLGPALRAQVAALVARYPNAIFYAPLAVGMHVDHQITYTVASEFVRGGVDIAFYEDFPYAATTGALERRLAALGGAELFLPVVISIDATLARKISALESYTSQIGTLFGDLATMAARVTAYAESLRPDEGTYGERIWMPR
ncbi:LmbE family protein [Oscillochloris trichoides DG-6]|uniref:LmbE family protein n=1 Tax=Oscillochloris trichoides DG-6 TaxID=765420 RepID=E1IAT9_9CHLR|nr:PIG-L family deacetylase [Oscillochloris trichoides]EFO81695.1 LmbE family protein [Oscillochloris trichoides DG-6]